MGVACHPFRIKFINNSLVLPNYSTTFIFIMGEEKKTIKKVQAKFPIDLVEAIEKSEGYKSMNGFLKRVSMKAVKYKKIV